MSDGAFALHADRWDGHVEHQLGKEFGRLFQLYGVHKASMEARKRGLSVMRKARADGSIKLTLVGRSYEIH